MRMQTNLIRPLLLKQRAFDQARAYYAQFENHPDPDKRLFFEDDLLEYMRFGYVVSRPTCFAMARPINIADPKTNLVEAAWFIRFAIGSLPEILMTLPWYMPRIVWCRRNDGVLRNYSTKRLYDIVKAQVKAKNEEPK